MKGYNSTSNNTVAKVKHHEPTSITLITSGTTHAALFTEKNMTDEVPPMLRSEVARVSIVFARKLSFSSVSQVSSAFSTSSSFRVMEKTMGHALTSARKSGRTPRSCFFLPWDLVFC